MTRYLSVFTNKRMLITLLLGFSGGIPLSLVGSTMQAWLGDSKIDIATIGLFSLIGLPYALKFLWGPIMDTYSFPFLGLRRGWMVISQIGLFAATVGLAFCAPSVDLKMFSLMAFLVAFFSASQDNVIDAYRTEIVEDKNELGAAAATYVTGYRIGTVISGGLAMILSDHMSWTNVYLLMAAINLVGLITVFFAHEPAVKKTLTVVSLKDSVIMPFLEFFLRHGAMEILIFIMVYKLSTLMATALTTNFLMSLGYTKTMIGGVTKGVGVFATIFGTLTGGSLMAKFGLKRSLWIFGVIQAFVGITYCVLSQVAASGDAKHIWLVVIICLDNLMMGLGTAALVGFMMNFASKQFTATQYALLTSIMAVTRVILVAHAGDVVAAIGWNWFFLATVPLAIPGLLLLNRFDHWQTAATEVHAKIPKFDIFMMVLFIASMIAFTSDPAWQLAGAKEMGQVATQIGAFGIVTVVILGIARPYFALGSKMVRSTSKA